MRAARPPLALCLLLAACTPPPKVAGYSQEPAAPPSPALPPLAAPPPPPPSTSAPTPAAATQVPPGPPASPKDALPAPTLASEQALGHPGGFAVEAWSRAGSYVAYCQPVGSTPQKPLDQRLDARGNAESPVTLTLAVGTERFDIDEVLATDPKGRFVVTLESGAPQLRDTAEHKVFALSALALDLERDALPDHRSVAFSQDGRELALLTHAPGKDATLTILDLEAPDPTVAPRSVPLAARPWRVSAEGQTFVVTTATPTAKGPGWPVRAWSQPNVRCVRGSFDAFARLSGPLRDPTLNHALVERGQTTARPAPGFVMALANGWVRREDDGRLLVVQGKQQRQLASARCGGRILGVDPTGGWFLVACEEYRPVKRDEPKPASTKKRPPPPKLRFPLYLLKPGVVRDLDVELMRVGVDMPPEPGTRFTAVRVETGLLLVDFGRGTAELLGPNDRVLLATETEVLLSCDGHLVRWVDGKRTQLGPIRSLDATVTGTAALAVGATLYTCCSHLAVGERAGGEWQAEALARAPLVLGDGFALVPHAAGTSTRWARGPVAVVRLATKPKTQAAPAESVASTAQ